MPRQDIPDLLVMLEEAYDMAVGARSGRAFQAGSPRWEANSFYPRLLDSLLWQPRRSADKLSLSSLTWKAGSMSVHPRQTSRVYFWCSTTIQRDT